MLELAFPGIIADKAEEAKLMYASSRAAQFYYGAMGYSKYSESFYRTGADEAALTIEEEKQFQASKEDRTMHLSLAAAMSINYWQTNHHLGAGKNSDLIRKMYDIFGLTWNNTLFDDFVAADHKGTFSPNCRTAIYNMYHVWDARSMLARIFTGAPYLTYICPANMFPGPFIYTDSLAKIRKKSDPAGTAKIMVPNKIFEIAKINGDIFFFPNKREIKLFQHNVEAVKLAGALAHQGATYLCSNLKVTPVNGNALAQDTPKLINELLTYAKIALAGTRISKSPIVSENSEASLMVHPAFTAYLNHITAYEEEDAVMKVVSTTMKGAGSVAEEADIKAQAEIISGEGTALEKTAARTELKRLMAARRTAIEDSVNDGIAAAKVQGLQAFASANRVLDA